MLAVVGANAVAGVTNAAEAPEGDAADSWLSSRPGPVSVGGAEGLLSSGQEIVADPTAVRLFMELDAEIEAEGRAAMAAAEAAAAAEATAAAEAAAAAKTAAAVTAAQAAFAAPAAAAARVSDSSTLGLEKSWQSESSLTEAVEAAAAQQQQPGVVGAGTADGEAKAQKSPDDTAMAAAAAAVTVVHESLEAAGVSEAQVGSTSAGGLAASPGSSGGVQQEGTEGDEEEEGVQEQPSCGCRCVIM